MKLTTLTALLVFLFIPKLPTVRVVGALRAIMMQGDLSAHLALDSLTKQPHLYGLGPVADLQGEIMLVDSKPYVCRVQQGKPVTRLDSSARAAMLVYASVPRWKTVLVQATVSSFADLEKQLDGWCRTNGIDGSEPFPFRLSGIVTKATYHVIDWKAGATHTLDNHKQFAYTSTLSNTPVELLGFYSNQHQGVFTHHTTNLHIHLMNADRTLVGHLDDLTISGPMILQLPE